MLPPMPLLSIADLRQQLAHLGALPLHQQRVLRRWVRAQPQDGGKRLLQDFLPRALREALPALVDRLHALVQIESQHPAADGSARRRCAW